MDGLSALSVAASVAQFIEFACSLVSESKEIYQSADGLPFRQVEAFTAAKRLAELSERINASRQVDQPGVKDVSTDDKALQAICDGCISVSKELTLKLKNLKAEDIQRFRGFKSFRQALKSMWSKKAFDDMERRLRGFQAELDAHLLVSLRQKFSNLAILQDKSFGTLDAHLRQSVKTFLPYLVDIHNKMKEVVAMQERVLDLHEREGFIKRYKAELSRAASEREDAYKDADSILLHELWFPEMSHRRVEIEEAHKKTFAWLLDYSPAERLCVKQGAEGRMWHNFTRWLQEPSGLYWINGKAGSGKSTLMRYICDNDITKKHLKSWAGSSELHMISFYFWNTGCKEQRSQIGLLRSLLHQILRARKDLTRFVFEEEWDYLVSSPRRNSRPERTWSFPKLKKAFKEALNLLGKDEMTSIFVDGLDELEGDPERLVILLKNVSEHPNVKVCLSSRPWVVFEEHFDGHPGLRLQDLTYDDIRLYVRDQLQENSKMKRLAESHHLQAAELSHNIVKKANGVFLWVKLVVWSLLAGLRNQDDFAELQKRLDLLPSDLDFLYRHMLQRIDPLYISQACRIFQIFNAFSDLHLQPTVLELDLSVTATIADALNPLTNIMSDQEISQRCHRMSTHLKTRCEGLLEVHDLRDRHWEDNQHSLHEPVEDASFKASAAFQHESQRVKADLKVAYLHRTVRDFLAADTVRQILLDNTGPITQFEPNMSLLMGYVVNLKRRLCSFYSRAPKPHDHVVWTVLCEVLQISQQVHLGCAYSPILSEFRDAALRWANRPYPGWYSNHIWTQEVWNHGFLSAGVVFGLTSFVERGLRTLSQNNQDILAWLMTRALGGQVGLMILDNQDKPFQHIKEPLFPSMANLLLCHGADPNAIDNTTIRQLSVWQFSMYSYYLALCFSEASQSQEENALAEIVQDMLEHGADQGSKCSSRHYISLVVEWSREYKPTELSLLRSNDGRPLLHLVNEARVDRGMVPLRNGYDQNDNGYSAVGGSYRSSAAGTIQLPSKRRKRSLSENEEDGDVAETGTLLQHKRYRFNIHASEDIGAT
ncbi:hypothetical protein N431DRAFT_327470 [Stipitochalara longipes BDJ]|nr:hypothetical protein N431DRAFT_327470 [Stipitochalara longipes BDJ]